MLQRVYGHQGADGMRANQCERIGVAPRPVAIDVKEQERFPQRSDVFLAQAIFGGNRSYIL